MNPGLLVAVHCYQGDRHQVEMLLPYFCHHEAPVVIVSPVDSQVHYIGPHHTKCAGLVQYFGQKSWDRQYAQLKLLLIDYPEIEWFLLNDADSFCLTPKLPDYLFEDKYTVYSNEVEDFRKPGGNTFTPPGMDYWPLDYHAGFDLVAMQPPYFLSRQALEKIVETCEGMAACPTTPFIDWWWIPACKKAGLKHLPFRTGASCETVTPNGKACMRSAILTSGATFIHAVKDQEALNGVLTAHYERTTKP